LYVRATWKQHSNHGQLCWHDPSLQGVCVCEAKTSSSTMVKSERAQLQACPSHVRHRTFSAAVVGYVLRETYPCNKAENVNAALEATISPTHWLSLKGSFSSESNKSSCSSIGALPFAAGLLAGFFSRFFFN